MSTPKYRRRVANARGYVAMVSERFDDARTWYEAGRNVIGEAEAERLRRWQRGEPQDDAPAAGEPGRPDARALLRPEGTPHERRSR